MASTEVTHPATGEVLDLDNAPSEQLAEAALELKEREAQLKSWRQAIENELLGRLDKGRRRKVVVGEYEVEIATSWRRVWDHEDLETVVAGLLDAGVLKHAEVGGLLTPQPAKLDGKLAASLIDRLSGDAREAVEGCFTWEQQKSRLTVVRSIPLLPPEVSNDGNH